MKFHTIVPADPTRSPITVDPSKRALAYESNGVRVWDGPSRNGDWTFYPYASIALVKKTTLETLEQTA